jgi:hypothetical protein
VPINGFASQQSSLAPLAVVFADEVKVEIIGVEFRTEPIHTDLTDETSKRASFLIVRVSLTNMSDEDVTSAIFQRLQVKDQHGVRYGVDTFATLLENSNREYEEQFANLVLEPDVTHYVDLVFDVDSSSKEFSFTEAMPTDADGKQTGTPFMIPLNLP